MYSQEVKFGYDPRQHECPPLSAQVCVGVTRHALFSLLPAAGRRPHDGQGLWGAPGLVGEQGTSSGSENFSRLIWEQVDGGRRGLQQMI